MPDRIALRPNEPVTLSLVDPYADSCTMYDAERCIGEYRTTDGRILALPRPAVLKLAELDPAPGEEIGIARYDRKNGKRGVEWAVWLTASAEKQRAVEEEAEPPSDTVALLAASIEKARRRNGHPVPIRKEVAPAETPQRRLFDRCHMPTCNAVLLADESKCNCARDWRGTGTDGPAAALQPAARSIPRPALATKTPYGQMLRHIVHTVEAVLKAEGVALGDGPKQDLYTTVYIDAAKRCGVEYDFTRGAE